MNRFRIFSSILVLCAVVSINGCGVTSNPLSILSSNTVTFTVKGTNVSLTPTYSNVKDSVRIIASDLQHNFLLGSTGIKAAGTYHYDIPDSGNIAIAYTDATGIKYASLPLGGIAISAISSTTYSATFTATLVSLSLPLDTIALTNGKIAIK